MLRELQAPTRSRKGLAAMDERSQALEEARDRAAAEPLAALRRTHEDLEKTGKRKLAETLAFLVDHVFEPRVNADVASKAVESTTNAISPRFEKETGRSLPAIIAYVRGETALNWMAADPEVSDETVAEMTGLSKYRLDRILDKMAAEGQLRQRRRTPPTCDPTSAATWKRAVRGQLPAHQVRKLVAHLRAHCPAAFADEAPATSGGDADLPVPVERRVAEQVWTLLSRLSHSARREVVVQYAFASRAFFDLLVGKSREAGRRDPQRGVEIAELAVLSVEVSAALLGELAHQLQAEGLAWLGNARCLALDFVGAEKNLEKALEVVDTHKELKGSLTDGIVSFIFGNLRLFEQDYDEATSRFDYALDVLERHESLPWQIQCLQQRAVAIVFVAGPTMAVPHFERILPLLPEAGDEDLTFQVRHNLANCLSRAGRYEDATAELRRLKDGDSLLAHPLWQWHLIATEGNVDHCLRRFSEAREKYVAACAGFEDLGASLYMAFVKLDLAILASETKRDGEVLEVVTAVLPFFESLKLCTETVESLRLLAEASSRMCITTELLSRLRDSLRRDPLVGLVD